MSEPEDQRQRNPHPCHDCGDETVPAGACRVCTTCGSSSGCS